jgi:hypothetical protein
MRTARMAAVLAPSDLALFGDPGWMKEAMAGFPAMFADGLQGYTDDRLADGAGWVTFDVNSIQCPVTVLHGEATAWSMSSTHITWPKLSRARNWSSSMTTAISAS